MATQYADRVHQITRTVGTDSYLIEEAVDGFQTLAESGIPDNEQVYYCVTNDIDWEVGLGTIESSGTRVARTIISDSSNSGNPINWPVGEKRFFVTVPAVQAELLLAVPGKLDTNANAVSASRWFNARTISLIGDLSASFSLDGSSNITTSVTVLNNSHTHVISNVSGLQSELNAKLSTTATAASSSTVINVRTGGTLRVWSGTQAQYNAISRSSTTLYFVT